VGGVFELGFCAVTSLVGEEMCIIQDESLARGPKLLSIKNYVIEIVT